MGIISRSRSLRYVALSALMALGPMNAGADDIGRPLRIRATPTVAHAPVDIFVYVSVTPREQNRLLRVTAESEDYFRSSEAPLEGQYSAAVNTFRFRDLPAGGYEVRAELIVSGGRTAQVETCIVQLF